MDVKHWTCLGKNAPSHAHFVAQGYEKRPQKGVLHFTKKYNEKRQSQYTALGANELPDISRTPSVKVQRELRKEVGFSCPMPGLEGTERCGNPYLTWHHFDPPWRKKHHHNPEGMIALCRTHHDIADQGAYTIEQLHKFKKQASNRFRKVLGKLEWMRHNTLAVVGGNFYYNTPTIFQYYENRIIWFERDNQNYLLLNIDLLPLPSSSRVQMQNNMWQVIDEPVDIECPASGKLIHVKYENGNSLKIEFQNIDSASKFQNKYSDVFLPSIHLPIVVVEVYMSVKEANISFSSKETGLNTNTYKGNFLHNLPVALGFHSTVGGIIDNSKIND